MTARAKKAAKPAKAKPAKAKPVARHCRCGHKINQYVDETQRTCSDCARLLEEAASRILVGLLTVADAGPRPERIRALVATAGIYARALVDEIRGVADAPDEDAEEPFLARGWTRDADGTLHAPKGLTGARGRPVGGAVAAERRRVARADAEVDEAVSP